MYQKIVVPVALDHESDINRAVEIAKRLRADGGEITILHVLEEIPTYVVSQMPEGVLEEVRGATFRNVEDIARSAGEGVAWRVISGSPGNAIVEYAENQGVDCIVMGSHKPGLTDYFLGSTAARVVRHAPCSVQVIR